MTRLPNLCRSDGSCSHTCEQGECIGSVNASRALFRMAPLHTDDGGHRVSGSDSLRLRIERATKPAPLSTLICPCIVAGATVAALIYLLA